MKTLKALWSDQRGEASFLSLVLLVTIVALGAVVGLTTLRDQIVQELGDVALAIENIDQSYTAAGSTFVDPGPFPTDPSGAAPACLNLSIPPGP